MTENQGIVFYILVGVLLLGLFAGLGCQKQIPQPEPNSVQITIYGSMPSDRRIEYVVERAKEFCHKRGSLLESVKIWHNKETNDSTVLYKCRSQNGSN